MVAEVPMNDMSRFVSAGKRMLKCSGSPCHIASDKNAGEICGTRRLSPSSVFPLKRELKIDLRQAGKIGLFADRDQHGTQKIPAIGFPNVGKRLIIFPFSCFPESALATYPVNICLFCSDDASGHLSRMKQGAFFSRSLALFHKDGEIRESSR
jgi:hypothetical protein